MQDKKTVSGVNYFRLRPQLGIGKTESTSVDLFGVQKAKEFPSKKRYGPLGYKGKSASPFSNLFSVRRS